MNLVCIRDGISGMSSGTVYTLDNVDLDAGTISVMEYKNEYNKKVIYKDLVLNRDVIFLHKRGEKPQSPAFYEMLLTYVDSIRKGGGDVSGFISSIEKMSVFKMMEVLAPNRVRFMSIPKPLNIGTCNG